MATGDLEGNLERLRVQLRTIGYPHPLDLQGLKDGNPAAILPLLHYALLGYSRHIARYLVDNGYALFAKSDLRFVECTLKYLREDFGYRCPLTVAQILSRGFAERKCIFVHDVIQACKRKHSELVKQARLTQQARKALKRNTTELFDPANIDCLHMDETAAMAMEKAQERQSKRFPTHKLQSRSFRRDQVGPDGKLNIDLEHTTTINLEDPDGKPQKPIEVIWLNNSGNPAYYSNNPYAKEREAMKSPQSPAKYQDNEPSDMHMDSYDDESPQEQSPRREESPHVMRRGESPRRRESPRRGDTPMKEAPRSHTPKRDMRREKAPSESPKNESVDASLARCYESLRNQIVDVAEKLEKQVLNLKGEVDKMTTTMQTKLTNLERQTQLLAQNVPYQHGSGRGLPTYEYQHAYERTFPHRGLDEMAVPMSGRDYQRNISFLNHEVPPVASANSFRGNNHPIGTVMNHPISIGMNHPINPGMNHPISTEELIANVKARCNQTKELLMENGWSGPS